MRELDPKLVAKCVHTIQMLSADGVEKAASGHPGTPMALAPMAFEIWMRHLAYDPADPRWPGRDRFVLSCGHASMLLYSLLHLGGYDLSLDDLKRFRQVGSKAPGHPEAGHTPGVETTTGPLGQGLANAVGIATSLKMLSARFDDAGQKLFGSRVFCLASDGDMMEGITGEASSLAGHLGLDNLIVCYDDNGITIDGKTSLAFSEDVGRRYEAYGWHVQHIDGHDHTAIRSALDRAVAEAGRPKLIVMRTVIGIGAPNKQGTAKAHGEPLGAEEIKLTKQAIGWPIEPAFLVPDDVRAVFADRADENKKSHAAWKTVEAALRKKGGEKADLYGKILAKEVPANLLGELVKAVPTKDMATRVSASVIEQRAAALVPSLAGGSADLNPSCKTFIEGSAAVVKGDFAGRNIHFGIREHAMGAFMNGMALSDGFIPFGSTFFVFADYVRPAIRIAALSHARSIFVFTHDSIYVGEDGPTHQPVEQLWSLRVIPNVDVVRPCDAMECAAAWTHAINRTDGPTVLALTRQNLPLLERPAGFDPATMLKGAYVIAEAKGGKPSLVIVATGSEVSVAVGAKKLLEEKGESVRVVSCLCLEQFMRQDKAYVASVLPEGVKRVSIEIGRTAPWRSVVGLEGLALGIDEFGQSGPYKELQKLYGMTPEAVTEKVLAWKA
jgi:transketolase